MESLLKILAEIRPDVDFEDNKELVDSGELDSFDIVTLVGDCATLTTLKSVQTKSCPKTSIPLKQSWHW